MTIEEAGELILINRPYIDCVHCSEGFRHDCPWCRGFGTHLDGDYLRACYLLQIDPPEPFHVVVQRERWLGGR